MLVLWQICVCLQEWFAVYVELNQQIAALLSAGEEEEVVELKALQQQLSDVCYRQASQLEGRQNVLQAAQGFHSTTQEVTHTHTHVRVRTVSHAVNAWWSDWKSDFSVSEAGKRKV